MPWWPPTDPAKGLDRAGALGSETTEVTTASDREIASERVFDLPGDRVLAPYPPRSKVPLGEH